MLAMTGGAPPPVSGGSVVTGMSPQSRTGKQGLDLTEQPFEVDRLGVVIVAARLHGLLAVAG